jgi:prepilin-type N-terminal cleavage/methylation domain-containing protein
MGQSRHKSGFTIVELLIVIVVIAILAAIIIVVWNGVVEHARNTKRLSDLSSLKQTIESYNAEHGTYPATTSLPPANWHSTDVRTDSNCFNGTKDTNWIPSLTTTLPQSDPNPGGGVGGTGGCYLYASDGTSYILSAWNMVNTPQTTDMYRRQGFREFQTTTSTQFYTCNSSVIGGVNAGSYNADQDYYKHSYTITNITNCDETPPPGA